ncbi:hypothetical protein F5X96DRAFT_683749 [Biscogniauxia mediterranea]|nr:hypothetical protein F5X96DRAFT_683749 [Biscogniauxia mediterranea]
MNAEANEFRLAVEGNPEALAISTLIPPRLVKLVCSTTAEEEEREGAVAWHYIIVLTRLCNDPSCEYEDEGIRKSVIFFWNKLLDFNGDRDLSDEQLQKLINLGYLFERKRIETTGLAITDSVIRWIDVANDNYRCHSDYATSQLKRFTEKWNEQKFAAAQRFEDQFQQLSGPCANTTSMPYDLAGLLSSGRAHDIESVFEDMKSTMVSDFDIANWVDFIDQYPCLDPATAGDDGSRASTGRTLCESVAKNEESVDVKNEETERGIFDITVKEEEAKKSDKVDGRLISMTREQKAIWEKVIREKMTGEKKATVKEETRLSRNTR